MDLFRKGRCILADLFLRNSLNTNDQKGKFGEKLAKKYKPAMDSFKDQYGKEGESVYYATMTKKAKKGEKA